jgi:uncharacterized delta-60 repeat protein
MVRSLLCCFLAVVCGSALAADGLPDSTFGIFASGRNIVALDQGGTNSDTIVDVLVNADRSLFMVGTARGAGTNSRFAITKLTPDGTIDPTFGVNGTVYTVSTNLQASRARLDSAGNIVIVGSASFSGADTDFAVCRFTAQGQAAIFSALGSNCQTVPFDLGGNLTDQARDFRFDELGNILIAGSAGLTATHDYAALARIRPDGTLDPLFSTEGKVTFQIAPNLINHFNALAIGAEGKFYAAGEAGDPASVNGTSVVFARLTTSGNFDPTYQNGQGFVLFTINDGDAFHRNESATSLERLSDGNLLMAGTADSGSGANQRLGFIFKVANVNFGSLVSGFGNIGRTLVTGGYSLQFNHLLLQSDNKIVLTGTRRNTAAAPALMNVIRMDTDGTLDADFGTFGRIDADFFLAGSDDFGIAAATQDGSLIVAGHSLAQGPENLDQTVTRLHNDLIFADDLE